KNKISVGFADRFIYRAVGTHFFFMRLRSKVLGHPFKIFDFVKGSSSYFFFIIYSLGRKPDKL
ncbi:MAG: hypothetical protein IJE02_08220, partial [Clostridia bacterium]|nr:hypothetical protein [Clostridia bacterium]